MRRQAEYAVRAPLVGGRASGTPGRHGSGQGHICLDWALASWMWKAFEGIRCGYQRGDTRNLEGACVWRAPVRASQTRPSCTGPWTLRHHCPRPPRPGCPDSPRMARPLAQPPPGRCCQPRGPWRLRQKEGAPPRGQGPVAGAQDVASTGAPRGGLSLARPRPRKRQLGSSVPLKAPVAGWVLQPP